jgi:hypothetical protein
MSSSTPVIIDLSFDERFNNRTCSKRMCESMFENLVSSKKLLRGISQSDVELAASKTLHFSLLQAMSCENSSGMKRLWVKR